MTNPLLALAAGLAIPAFGPDPVRLEAVLAPLSALEPELHAFYVDLHRNPELSLVEKETADKVAARLRAEGYTVTQGVGGYGLVAILKNGEGPVLMIRTDLDALPVEEKTGLPYASRVRSKGADGEEVGVMHACGHDVHMTVFTGTATVLARAKDRWKGTLVFVGQPAEERGAGAEAMLADGLFTRFPRPDHAVALHVTGDLAVGQASLTPGAAFASVDSVDITVFGKGAHGATPHRGVDPIVIGSRIVLALQTLVSRERDPFDPAVVTVGAFHGGHKHNVIDDKVTMMLTVRAYTDEVRQALLAGIRRIARAEAEAGNAPREPEVKVVEGTPSLYNDPAFSARVSGALGVALGKERVLTAKPAMVSEDFSEYGRAGVPSVMFWLGVSEEKALAAAKAAGTSLPAIHSPRFQPEPHGSVRAGIRSLSAVALEVLPPR